MRYVEKTVVVHEPCPQCGSKNLKQVVFEYLGDQGEVLTRNPGPHKCPKGCLLTGADFEGTNGTG